AGFHPPAFAFCSRRAAARELHPMPTTPLVSTAVRVQPHLSRMRGPPREPRLMMKIRPLHDRILVKRIDEEAKTKGGLFIPDTAKEKPMEGKVLAVGKGRVDEDGVLHPLDVQK